MFLTYFSSNPSGRATSSGLSCSVICLHCVSRPSLVILSNASWNHSKWAAKSWNQTNTKTLKRRLMFSWLVHSPPERAVRVQTLTGDIVLCSWARHFTLIVPLSTTVYNWVPVKLVLGWEEKYSQSLRATETGISAGLIDYLARM